ncbi:MAG TPA: DUF1572 family protein [Terriglobia bacterium]|nr:DUF1572 family protein [Terriglobia bacterium]
MHSSDVLQSARFELRKMKRRADRALSQVAPEDLFRKLDPESNSLAEILKHVGGNLRSRWTDFLDSDGEKADRNRDAEFSLGSADTPESVRQAWEEGWDCLLRSLQALRPEQMDRTVYIRGEAHSVLQALHRTMTHSANHVGQIIYLAKHFAGARWQALTVPRGQSEHYRRALARQETGGYLSES